MTNRRAHKRFNAAVAAELEIDGTHAVHEGTTRDVSQGGASVHLDTPVPEGAKVLLTLILTEDGIESAHEEALQVRAEIMWAVPADDGGHMFGLRFGGLNAAQNQRLQRFLAALKETAPATAD